MEQLNRKRRQDEDIGYNNNAEQLQLQNNKYQDMRAAPQRLNKSSGFANLVRNKSAPPGLEKKLSKELNKPSEIYQENIKLESFQSELMVFKNLLYDAQSMIKAEVKDFSGFLTVKDYSQKLSSNNENFKYC